MIKNGDDIFNDDNIKIYINKIYNTETDDSKSDNEDYGQKQKTNAQRREGGGVGSTTVKVKRD